MKYLFLLAFLLPIKLQAQADPCEMSNGKPKWCDTPFGITLTSFTGQNGHLSWQAQEDSRHAYYRIERSYDGRNFEAIGTTYGKEFVDYSVRTSAYYRLVDVELGGSETKHRMIYVEINNAFANLPKGQILIINRRKYFIK